MKKLILSALLLSILILPVGADEKENASPGYTIVEDKANLPILTPGLSGRKVEKIRLDNKLEAYLVSDPQTPQSGAVLSVEVGSWDEPSEYPGLAHFLEHMLFLGTKKYPEEGGYQAYVVENGGMANAFTTNDQTSYMFTVNNYALPGALDRFADFFKEPLFNPSGVNRELRAIDQEFSKNIEKDEVRELFVLKENSNPNHPNRRFTAGNSKTLANVSQETLKKFYKEKYSANLMHLVVYSSLPIDELRKLVVENFSGVPNHDRKELELDPALTPHSDQLNGKIIYVQPIKNLRLLTIVWDLPARFADMRTTRPEVILCYLLGHEGKESLLSELKRERLAEGIKCGAATIGPKTMEYYIEIELTDEGLAKYDSVLERLYQAIAGFKQKGIPQYLFDEIQRMGSIHYQYQSRPDLFTQLEKDATDIIDEDLETYPLQTQVIQKFDPEAAKELLGYLTPNTAIYLLSAPFSLTGTKAEKQEQWMGIPYTIKSIPGNILQRLNSISAAHPEIDLPAPNSFIPKNLTLVNQGEPKDERRIPHPVSLISDKSALIYFAPDTHYQLPEFYAWFEIKTPEIEMGKAMSVVLGDLFVKSVNDSIGKFSYDAEMAGLKYSVTRTDNGIGITLSGYSENAPLLFAEILKRLKEIHPSDDKFDIYKQSLLRQYSNTAKDSPLQQASELLKLLTYKNFTTDKHKAAALRKVNFEKFNQFTTGLFNHTYIEGLIYGNLNKGQAYDLSQQLIQTLGGVPYPKNDQLKKMVAVLPDNEGPFYLENKTKAKGNAVILAIEAPAYSIKTRAVQQLLQQMMEEPFFYELRTRQQTGYTVGNSAEDLERHLFSYFALLSNSHEARDLLSRFELFIEQFVQDLDKQADSEKTFEANKTALKQLLTQRPNNIEEMGKQLKQLAFTYDGDFDWIDKRIKALDELTYPEFLKTAHEILGKQNKRRFAVLVEGTQLDENLLDYTHINDINQLKKTLEYTPK